MTFNKIIYRCTLIAGILLMLFSVPHALGVTAVFDYIKNGEIGETYAKTAIIIWIFGSVTMLLLGATLVYLSKHLQMLSKNAWRLGTLIGIGLTSFGGGFFIQNPGSTHMLGFLLLGLLVLIPLVIFVRKFN